MQSKVMRGSRTTFRHFFQKAALYSTRILGFPFGEAVGFRRLKRSRSFFTCLPLACIKFCKQNFLRQKLSATSCFSPFLHALPFHSIPALTLSSLLYPGFRRSGSSRPLQSPFFILPALFKKHFSSQSFRSESLFSPEAQLLSHNFPQNAVLRATFFILNANICSFFYSITYKTCQHIAIFRKIFHFFYRLF